MKGKERCRILKEIRREIAESNDIEFITSECKHKGDCLGTCPKCEAELRYLERELEKRQRLGKAVAIAGLTVSVALTSSSCTELFSVAGNMEKNESGMEQVDGEMSEIVGDLPLAQPETGEIEQTEMGELELEGTLLEEFETSDLEGDLLEWAVPPISSVTEENFKELLGDCTRIMIQDAWRDYRTVQFETEEGQEYSCDFYLTEEHTLIQLIFDGNGLLYGGEFQYDFYEE